MHPLLQRFIYIFMSPKKLIDTINPLSVMDAARQINLLQPIKAIKVISLLENENKQQDLCKWLGYPAVAHMLGATKPKDMVEIFVGLHRRLQVKLLQLIDPVKASQLLDSIPPMERNFFLQGIAPAAVSRIFPCWSLAKQHKILNSMEQKEQFHLVACLPVKNILALAQEWSLQQIITLLSILSPSKFVKVFNTLPADGQVQTLNAIPPKRVATVIDLLDIDNAITILDKLFLPQITGILNAITEYKSATIFEKFAPAKQETILPELKAMNVLNIIRNCPVTQQVHYLKNIRPERAGEVLKEMSRAEIRVLFKEFEPSLFEQFINLLPAERRLPILKEIPPDKLVRVLEFVQGDNQVDLFDVWSFEEQIGFLEKMADGPAAKLLIHCPENDQVELLKKMTARKAANLLALWQPKDLANLLARFDPKPALADILRLWSPDFRNNVFEQIEDFSLVESIEIHL